MSNQTEEMRNAVVNALAELGLTNQDLIAPEQLAEGYEAYLTMQHKLHNERHRRPGQSFSEAMREFNEAHPEESKRVSALIADACGL